MFKSKLIASGDRVDSRITTRAQAFGTLVNEVVHSLNSLSQSPFIEKVGR